MTDEYYMMQAIKEARRALADDEIPIGAVVVLNDKIIARGYNMTERLNDPTAHAEMIALTSAFNTLGAKFLPEAKLFVTIEPCLMCAGAIFWSRVSKIIYGAEDEKNGYKRVAQGNWPFHPKTELLRGVMKEECAQLIKDFFKKKR
jgi:tRNA(adenine34) deaminase